MSFSEYSYWLSSQQLLIQIHYLGDLEECLCHNLYSVLGSSSFSIRSLLPCNWRKNMVLI
jgi:hypothetical protein